MYFWYSNLHPGWSETTRILNNLEFYRSHSDIFPRFLGSGTITDSGGEAGWGVVFILKKSLCYTKNKAIVSDKACKNLVRSEDSKWKWDKLILIQKLQTLPSSEMKGFWGCRFMATSTEGAKLRVPLSSSTINARRSPFWRNGAGELVVRNHQLNHLPHLNPFIKSVFCAHVYSWL